MIQLIAVKPKNPEPDFFVFATLLAPLKSLMLRRAKTSREFLGGDG